jgi:hypothetical protein
MDHQVSAPGRDKAGLPGMKRKAASSPERVQDPAHVRGHPGTRTEPSLHREPRPTTSDDQTARPAALRRKRREPFVL